MKNIMSKGICLLLAIVMLGSLLAACNTEVSDTALNGVDISKYTIVYAQEDEDYSLRAAEYLQTQIKERTGVEIPVCEDDSGTYKHEIIVGDTNRALSKDIAMRSADMKFNIKADKGHIAIQARSFIIAAAAYYFVETYIPGSTFQSEIPKGIIVQHTPITEKPNNFIYLIGDGMGVNHTKLLEQYSIEEYITDSDSEDLFYGYYLPYQGLIHTGSLTGTTDSAAGATALACGVKTINGYVGINKKGVEVQSLTELAISLGKATAVMSSDVNTGATPAGFSAHAPSRSDSEVITSCQEKLEQEHGTIFECGLYTSNAYEEKIVEVLDKLDDDEDGFFLMYEEGYIDKNSHNRSLEGTVMYMGRFNQAIARFMEFAFYNPDTFLIITADHETGGLTMNADGKLIFTTGEHTGVDVAIFGYGQGAEIFEDYHKENNEVPKVIADLWGVENFGSEK